VTGVVQGGWEYVAAAYVATWLFVVGYSASLWLRAREER
jgi:CcmD family protein